MSNKLGQVAWGNFGPEFENLDGFIALLRQLIVDEKLGANPFNQSLNTFNSPSFVDLTLTGDAEAQNIDVVLVLNVDTIAEYTPDAGVTVDGVLLKDSAVTASGGISADTIAEYSAGVGVTIDGVLLKDTAVQLDANFFMHLSSGNPEIQFDGGDRIQYNRSANEFRVFIAGAPQPDLVIGQGTLYVNGEANPYTDSGATLGSSTLRWAALQLADGTAQTQCIIVNNSWRPAASATRTTMIGTNVGANSMNGTDVTLVGSDIGKAITTADGISIFGVNSGNAISNQSNVSLFGFSVAPSSTGNNTSLFGAYAGFSLTTGNNNTGHGFEALYSNQTGSGNTATGYRAGRAQQSSNSVFYGFDAGVLSNALFLTAIGSSSLSANTTGQRVTGLGWSSGATNATGSEMTFLGAGADAAASNLTNATAVGDGAVVQASHDMQLGDRVDNGTGILYFHTIPVADEANIGGGSTPAYMDNNGSCVRDPSYSKDTYSDTMQFDTDTSASISVVAERKGDQVFLKIPAWSISTTATSGDAFFNTALGATYRPAAATEWSAIIYVDGAAEVINFSVSTSGDLSFAKLSGTWTPSTSVAGSTMCFSWTV